MKPIKIRTRVILCVGRDQTLTVYQLSAIRHGLEHHQTSMHQCPSIVLHSNVTNHEKIGMQHRYLFGTQRIF